MFKMLSIPTDYVALTGDSSICIDLTPSAYDIGWNFDLGSFGSQGAMVVFTENASRPMNNIVLSFDPAMYTHFSLTPYKSQ